MRVKEIVLSRDIGKVKKGDTLVLEGDEQVFDPVGDLFVIHPDLPYGRSFIQARDVSKYKLTDGTVVRPIETDEGYASIWPDEVKIGCHTIPMSQAKKIVKEIQRITRKKRKK